MTSDELFSLAPGTPIVWWAMQTFGAVTANEPNRLVIQWNDDEEAELARDDEFLDELADELTAVVATD